MCKACDKSFCLSNSNEHYLHHPGLSVQANPTLSPKRNCLGQGSTMQGKWDKDNVNFEVRPCLHNISSNMLAEECAMSTWQDLQNMENMPCQHEMTRKALLTIRSLPWVRVPQVKQLGQRKVICPFIGKLISALIMCLNTTFSLFFRFHSLWARTPRRLRRGRILNRPFTRRFNLDHQDRLGTFPHQPRSSTGCRMFHPVPTWGHHVLPTSLRGPQSFCVALGVERYSSWLTMGATPK